MTKPLTMKMKILLGVLSIMLLVGGYAYLSYKQHLKNPDDTTIPSFSQLGQGVKTIFEVNKRSDERWIVVDSMATFNRLFRGLAVGAGAAIVLGLLMGCFPFIEALLIPPLSILSKIAPTAAVAVFFVMVGTGLEMYVAMIAFGVLPTMAQVVFAAVKDINNDEINKAMTLGASRGEIILNVIATQIKPRILEAIRLQIGPAMVYLIAAEMLCGDVGFGYRIRMQSKMLNMNIVYPYLLILAGFGFSMDLTLKWILRKWCPWYKEGGNS